MVGRGVPQARNEGLCYFAVSWWSSGWWLGLGGFSGLVVPARRWLETISMLVDKWVGGVFRKMLVVLFELTEEPCCVLKG